MASSLQWASTEADLLASDVPCQMSNVWLCMHAGSQALLTPAALTRAATPANKPRQTPAGNEAQPTQDYYSAQISIGVHA
jgi:hypothetical protein